MNASFASLSGFFIVISLLGSGCATKPLFNCNGEAGDDNTDLVCRIVTPGTNQ